jgi:hypothetical protein
MSMTHYKLENQDVNVLMVLQISEFVRPEGAVHMEQILHNVITGES